MTYKRDPVATPRLRGLPLRLFVETLEGPLGRSVLRKMTYDSGLGRFRQTSAGGAPPVQHPLPHPAHASSSHADPVSVAERALLRANLPGPARPATIADFAAAYREARLTPVEVADRVIAGMKRVEHLGAFIANDVSDLRAQAEASARRHRAGAPLGLLDGVPVAVKDEMDQEGYATTVGTAFLGRGKAGKDAALVAKLRQAGAVLIGKTNMHEIGINPIGLNPHHGAARNPWNPARITGGSSSGSAAAVAAGLCPVAIGADGGGSIRIPAGLCGVVGLKATWGRISEHGVYPLCWHVGHVGPIGATVGDVAVAFALIAGEDPADAATRGAPGVELSTLERDDLRGVRLGIHRRYFEDADPAVVRRAEQAVQALVAHGARVVEIPAPDLNTLLWTHAILILSEMATSLLPEIEEDSRRFGLDVRTNLAIGRYFSSTDYVHALRHRHKHTREMLEVMHSVDAIVTPTTATTAPEITEQALPEGESNLQMTDALMRFVRSANLTGFPALSVPAGYDDQGLPVSVQLTGRPWEEGLLLRLAQVIEAATERRFPEHHVQLLD